MIDCSKTVNYFAEKKRMTEQNPYPCCQRCIDCPLGSENNGRDLMCTEFEMLYPKEAIEIVQSWSDNFPRRTRKEVFLEAFPKAPTLNGYPKALPCQIYGKTDICSICNRNECYKIWDEPI